MWVVPHLGAGHADLGARVDVHPAVGLAGDGAAHGVGDAHGQGSPLLAVPKAHQGVCCLPWNTGKHRDGGSVLLLLLPLKVGNAPSPQTQPQRFVLPASQGGGSSHFSPSIPFLNPEHRAVTPRKHKTYLQHLV